MDNSGVKKPLEYEATTGNPPSSRTYYSLNPGKEHVARGRKT